MWCKKAVDLQQLTLFALHVCLWKWPLISSLTSGRKIGSWIFSTPLKVFWSPQSIGTEKIDSLLCRLSCKIKSNADMASIPKHLTCYHPQAPTTVYEDKHVWRITYLLENSLPVWPVLGDHVEAMFWRADWCLMVAKCSGYLQRRSTVIGQSDMHVLSTHLVTIHSHAILNVSFVTVALGLGSGSHISSHVQMKSKVVLVLKSMASGQW